MNLTRTILQRSLSLLEKVTINQSSGMFQKEAEENRALTLLLQRELKVATMNLMSSTKSHSLNMNKMRLFKRLLSRNLE